MAALILRKPLAEDYNGLDATEAIARIEGEVQDVLKTLEEEPPEDDAGLVATSVRLRELQRLKREFRDQRVAESFSTAAILDAMAIAAISEENEAAQHDHAVALALEAGEEPPTRTTNNEAAANSTGVDAATLSKLAARHVSVSVGEALQGEHGPSGVERECTICMDNKPWYEALSVPCGHHYCEDCVQALFRDSYTDESLFPPKCCQQVIPITGSEIALFLPKELRDPYENRLIETTSTDRTYCIACTKFILPANIADRTATCTSCEATTCAGCKKPTHDGDCDNDENDQLALELAESEGWRRCYQCRRMIELDTGCNHMKSVSIIPLSQHSLISHTVVAVALSSATNVARPGRRATVRSGTKKISTTAPSASPTEIVADVLVLHRKRRSVRSPSNFVSTTSALTRSGTSFVERSSARSVMIICRLSSSSVRSATFASADDAVGIVSSFKGSVSRYQPLTSDR